MCGIVAAIRAEGDVLPEVLAGLKTLEILQRPGSYEQVFETGRRLKAGLEAAMHDNGHAAKVIGEPPLFDVFFTDGPVENYRDMLAADAAKGRAFNALLRERGIFKGDSKYYISLAHDEADIEQTLAAFTGAAKALKEV